MIDRDHVLVLSRSFMFSFQQQFTTPSVMDHFVVIQQSI